MPRTVRPEHHADRIACLAIHPCNACANAALQKPLTGNGFQAWFMKQAGARPNLPCSKHQGRRIVHRVDHHGDPKPPTGLEREAYVAWLQEALRKERREVQRLRMCLNSAGKSMAKALTRPQDNDPGLPPRSSHVATTSLRVDLKAPAPGATAVADLPPLDALHAKATPA